MLLLYFETLKSSIYAVLSHSDQTGVCRAIWSNPKFKPKNQTDKVMGKTLNDQTEPNTKHKSVERVIKGINEPTERTIHKKQK